MLDRIITFLRDEAVLCIAFVFAVASIVLVGDVTSAPSYIDWRVIVLLFCLMASVAGLSASGVMARIARALVAGEKSKRIVCFALVMLPFFASMLVTNDVALLTFVPIAVLALACATFGSERSRVTIKLDDSAIDVRRFALHAALFALSVLSVLRVIPYEALIIVVAAALFVFDRRIFPKVDYALLATFVCFFVFSGNMAHMPAMQDFLGSLMQGHPMLTSLVTSQVISNVPASVLLAGFTDNWHSLLIGVDLGGLGTPIASLASLIALRLYMHTEHANLATFMKEFAIANIATLALMIILYTALFVI